MKFVKMHGAGNDYVFVNCFVEKVEDPAALARAVSDRHTGIGSDGLILLGPADDSAADAEMRIFNADGSEAEMCGNGARCAAKLLHDEGLAPGPVVRLETLAGMRAARILLGADGRVAGADIEMGVPQVGAAERVEVKGRILGGLRISVGNPHFVILIENVAGFPFREIAPGIETAPCFPDRTNVEFVQVCNDGSLLVRVWERGSGETRACGTGAVASVAAAVARGRIEAGGGVTVRLPGGDLSVRWDGSDSAWLAGEAIEVFRGVWRHGTRAGDGSEWERASADGES
jgi:diaminopimelate epimerase